MNENELLAVFRGCERLLIQAGAITCIVMGTLLYRWGIQGKQAVEGSVAGFAFKIANGAPGSVLALFGMVVLVVGLRSPLTLSEDTTSYGEGSPTPDSHGLSEPTTEPNPEDAGPQAGAQREDTKAEPIAQTTLTRRQHRHAEYADESDADAIWRIIASLGQLEVSAAEAKTVLDAFRDKARKALARDDLPAALRNFLQALADTPADANAAATLEQLSTRARQLVAARDAR